MFESNRVLEAQLGRRRHDPNLTLAIPNDQLLNLIDQVHPLGVWKVDLGSKKVLWNDRVYQIHGEEPRSTPITLDRAVSYYPTEDQRALTKLIAQAVSMKSGYRAVLRLKRPDGSMRIVESVGRVSCDDAGAASGLYGIIRDITQMTEWKNSASHQTQLLKTFIENVPAPVAVLDRSLKYVAVSLRFYEAFDLDPGHSLIGKSHLDVFPNLPEVWIQQYQLALKGHAFTRFEDNFQHSDGRIVTITRKHIPWRNQAGDIGGIVLIGELKLPEKN